MNPKNRITPEVFLRSALDSIAYFGKNELYSIVTDHFFGLKRVTPSTEHALLFIGTELSEASELLLSRVAYRRNHPNDKESFSKERFAEELGDIIYMAIIAGYVEGVDPVEAMIKKMESQIKKELKK